MKLPLPKPPAKNIKSPQNVQKINQQLQQLGHEFRVASARGDYQQAHKLVQKVLKIVPNHANAMMDLAYSELRLQRYHDAYVHYHQAIQLFAKQVDTNLYDGLAEVCFYLNKTDELQRYGALAIQSKMDQVAQQNPLPLPSEQPAAFDLSQPSANIISYSLFGNNPRYCEVAIENVHLAKSIYPGWTCRFYVDDTVPTTVQQRLSDAGAQVFKVNLTQQQMSGLFWRFLVMDDPSVQRFLIRDADSLLSYREQAAVQAWLHSGLWFHCMRDWYSHTELLLAGMWGGCNGVLHNVQASILNYQQQHRAVARVIDQHFLRFYLWPTVRQSLLSHDRYSFAAHSLPFPVSMESMPFEQHTQFHVGMNFGSSMAEVLIHDTDATLVEWCLMDEQDVVICRYYSEVLPNRHIQIWLPQNYAEKLSTKAWKLLTYPQQNSH